MGSPNGQESTPLKIPKIMNGYEYYGNPNIVPPRRKPPPILNQVRTGIIVSMMLISLVLSAYNSYLLFVSTDEFNQVQESLQQMAEIMVELDDVIRGEVKPRVNLISHSLTWKLPNAVLAAFQKSNSDLGGILNGVTADLRTLIDLYKSILGFNDDWIITPSTQQLTCTLTPAHNIQVMYDKVYKARDLYSELFSTVKNYSHIIGNNTLQIQEIESLDNHTAEVLEAERSMISTVYEILKKYVSPTEDESTLFQFLRYMRGYTNDTSKIIDLPQLTTAAPTTYKNVTSKIRGKRHVARLVPTQSRGRQQFKLSSNARVFFKTIKDKVQDTCSLVKSILGYRRDMCMQDHQALDLINCISSMLH